MKLMTMVVLSLLLVLSLGMAAFADSEWVEAKEQSCANVCAAVKLSPVQSGIYKNGESFYVCSANAQGEGYRSGYNLKPSWSNACIVGYGGKEVPVTPYRCLCAK